MPSFFKKHKNDMILLLSLFALSAILLTVGALLKKPGSEVEITVDGKVVGVYPLTEDRRTDIGTGNVLVISGGYAFMESADCKNQTCVRHRPVSKAGETIICLPHRVIVRIVGESGDGPDGYSR